MQASCPHSHMCSSCAIPALHEYRLPRPGNNDNRDGTLESPQLLCLRTACGSIVVVESVGYVILYVRDLDASAAFYRDVVGLPFKFRDAGYAELATGETRFGLLEHTRASDLIRREPTKGGPARSSSSSTTSMPKPSGSGASASSSSPARWTGRGGTGPSTSSIQTGSWSSWPRRSPGSCLAMADADERAVILAYHEATKHSPVSVRTRAHYLDWDNRPFPFKFYTDLERIPLPEDISSLDVPALEAIGVTSVLDPTPGPDIAALARLLVLGAGVHHTKTFRKGGVPHFRNYASAGALYPVEVYMGCADLQGLPAGVYHFDPQGPTLTSLREGDHRGHLVRATAGEPAAARAPVVLVLTGIPWRTAWK